MEEKRYGGKSPSREEALELVLKEFSKEFSKDILVEEELCDRTFRIYEIHRENVYKIGYDCIFTIQEIPTNTINLVTDYKHLEYPIKYSFKERIKILLKGRI